MGNNLNVGSDCLIGSFVHIVRHVADGALMKGSPSVVDEKSTWTKLKIGKL